MARDSRMMASVATASYVHGTSSAPLLGETIGESLRRAVERHGDREALVVRHQGYRATYAQLWEQVDRAARGLLARGVAEGRPRRDLGAEPVRVGRRPVRDRPHRRDPRQHQPGVQGNRARVRAPEGRRQRARARAWLPPDRLRRDARRGARRLPCVARGDRARGRLGDAARRRRRRRRRASSPSARRGSSSTIRSTSSTRPGRPAFRRAPRSPTTTSSTTATSSRGRSATPSATGSACPFPSTTASAW